MKVKARDGSDRFTADVDLCTIFCNECERPWGVVLPRKHDDTDVLRATLELQNSFRVWWAKLWQDNEAVGTCPPVEMPEPALTSVVYVSEASWRFFDDIGVNCNVEAGSWNEIDWCDLPSWWINRRRRFALRWDCCDLGYPA